MVTSTVRNAMVTEQFLSGLNFMIIDAIMKAENALYVMNLEG